MFDVTHHSTPAAPSRAPARQPQYPALGGMSRWMALNGTC
jgi:hypothetical protein